MVPCKRFTAVVALLLTGVTLSQSFAVATSTSSLESTYEVEEVTTDSLPDRVASYDLDVINLDEVVSEAPQLRESAVTATCIGRYGGNIELEVYMILSDVSENVTFAVYDGQYYRLSPNVSGDPARTIIKLDPADWEIVVAGTSSSTTNTGTDVHRAIDGGTVTSSTSVTPGLYERGDVHYPVCPANEGEVLENFLALIGGLLFNPIGQAYTVVDLDFLDVFRLRCCTRPLDRRTTVLVVPGTPVIMWLRTTLTNAGSLDMRYVLIPNIDVVITSGLFVGFCIRHELWKSLAGWGVAFATVVVATDAVAVSIAGTTFDALGLVVGWFGGLSLVPYGCVLMSDSENECEEGPDAVTAGKLGER